MLARTPALVLLSISLAAPAFAQEGPSASTSSDSAHGFGVGVYGVLVAPGTPFGFGGASVEYDVGDFRVAGLFGMAVDDSGDDGFSVGARFLLPVHRATGADFSVGAGVALGHTFRPFQEDLTYVLLEGLGQIRVFLVDNVALHGNLGIGFAAGESRLLFGVGAQLVGGFGMTYYF